MSAPTRNYTVTIDDAGRRCLRTGASYSLTCLTDTQWVKLFGRRMTKPKRYGCGSYACVYESDEAGKVIKLTTDPGDVHTTMGAQGIPGVVTLYSALQIAGNDERWAMRVEKLTPTAASETLSDGLKCARRIPAVKVHAQCCDMQIVRALKTAARIPVADTVSSCLSLMAMVQQTSDAFRERKLLFFDWHAANLGRNANGKWKILDLGYNVDYVADRPVLKGARSRKRRRKLNLAML